MGGIDLEISDAEKNEINNGDNGGVILNNAGLVHLNGAQAVTFSRIRYIDSDYKRVMRQQRILLAMADKAQNMEVDELTDIAADVKDIVLSSMDKGELEDLATAFMVMEIEDVEQFRIPADNTFESGTFDGVWSIRPDLEENAKILPSYIYG
jgi:anionic cell wall polymer biosynthesis LytR-Cps2A-Psr (LCP) family protein